MIFVYEGLDEMDRVICKVPTSRKDEELAKEKIRIKTKRDLKVRYAGIKL